MAKRAGDYLHGTFPEEQGRLSLLNRLMNEKVVAKLSLKGGERVVDFGAGLGQLSRGIARAAGRAVVGIERSPEQIAEARSQAEAGGEQQLLDLRQGEVEAPPLRSDEWGTFDVAHARFVLEHVQDPAAVVATMVRTVRPGGRVVVLDDDHDVLRCHPEPPGFPALWRAYERTYDRIGCDPYVGRRLVSLLHEAGAKPVACDFIFFGGCAGEERFAGLVENMIGLFLGAREPIVSGGLLSGAELDQAIEELRRWGRRPDAAFWYAIFWAEGVRR